MHEQKYLEGELPVYRPVPLTSPGYRVAPTREVTWGQLFSLIARNRWLALGIICLVMVSAVTITLLMQPIYEATTRLEIDPPNTELVSFRDSRGVSPAVDPDYLETQAEILRSEELAVQVIRKLQLDREPDIVGSSDRHGFIGALLARARSFLPSRNTQSHSGEGDSSAGIVLTSAENKVLRIYKRRLGVSVMRNTDLVDVSFSSSDPTLAARVTNTLAEFYMDRNYRVRYEMAMQATQGLSKQLDDLREKVERSNRALADFQNANGIVDIDEKQNTITQTVGDLTRQLNAAKGERIQLEADVKTMDQAGVDALPQVRNNNLIQELSRMLAEVSAHMAEAEAVYGDKNANVRKYRNQVNNLQERLRDERSRIASSLRASYNSAVTRQGLLTASIDSMKSKIHEMNQTVVQNSSLKKQVQVNEDLYNGLFTKLKEAGIAAGLRSSTIRVVDRARVPDRPVKPQVIVNLGIGFVLALILAVGMPLLRELMADRLHVPEDIRVLTGIAPIGVMPLITAGEGTARLTKNPSRLLGGLPGVRAPTLVYDPASMGAEAIRNLWTSMRFARPEAPPRTILITSALAGEGKTTIAARLALVLAESSRTCLLDADLRNPSVAAAFGLKIDQGLGQVLAGSTSLESVMVQLSQVSKLTLIPGGRSLPNPGELIESEGMETILKSLCSNFDCVVIDSPPVVPFADARILSQFVDGVLLIGRSGLTKSEDLNETIEALERVHVPLLGVILNGVGPPSSYYRRHKSYYGCAKEG